MDKNSSMYKTVLLGCVCAVAGVLLAIVNSITAPVIAENAIANVKKNLIEIYPDVDDFKDISSDCLKDDDSGLIDAVYQAGDEGYIFYMRFFVEYGLIEMRGAPSQGHVEMKQL